MQRVTTTVYCDMTWDMRTFILEACDEENVVQQYSSSESDEQDNVRIRVLINIGVITHPWRHGIKDCT